MKAVLGDCLVLLILAIAGIELPSLGGGFSDSWDADSHRLPLLLIKLVRAKIFLSNFSPRENLFLFPPFPPCDYKYTIEVVFFGDYISHDCKATRRAVL